METLPLTEKIVNDAKREAEKIIKEGKDKAKQILQDAEKKSASVYETIIANVKKEAEERKKRILTTANLDIRRETLYTKQEILDETFNRALKVLYNMDNNRYRSLIKGMLMKSAHTGDEEIVISSKDKDIINNAFLESVNGELKKIGKKGELKANMGFKDSRGFILKGKDMEINCSFDVILKNLRDEMEAEIASILF